MTDIWSAAGGAGAIEPLAGTGYRLVESQEQVGTARIVSSLADQALLEEMLEQSKPPPVPGTERLHYLLATPFRYPPLRHGSRFGSRLEPSLLYAGTTQAVTLCESAYYRFYFYHDNANGWPGERLESQHTLFSFRYRTEHGLRLQSGPFAPFQSTLTDPVQYGPTQALGGEMRSAGVEAFQYRSARDKRGGINVALFTPHALASKRPERQAACLCLTRAEQVEFSTGNAVYTFPLGDFLVDGRLPIPAS